MNFTTNTRAHRPIIRIWRTRERHRAKMGAVGATDHPLPALAISRACLTLEHPPPASLETVFQVIQMMLSHILAPQVGSTGRARTCDALINNQVLYQLSYGRSFYSPGDKGRRNIPGGPPTPPEVVLCRLGACKEGSRTRSAHPEFEPVVPSAFAGVVPFSIHLLACPVGVEPTASRLKVGRSPG